MKRVLILLLSMVLVVGCSGTNKITKSSQATPAITTKHCDLSPFGSVVLAGDAKVELINGPYAIDITGIGAERYKCQYSVIKQVLRVNNIDQNISSAEVKVTAPALRKITASDNATVSAKNFKTDKLAIIAKDYGTVNLEGEFNIDEISQLGRGRIDIDWINSNKLLISGYNSGPISLAGTVNRMVVKLVKGAELYARYLRTQKAAVITADKAQAEVLALDNLNAFAVNKSSIRYYKKPKNLLVVTKDSGNVLQLDAMP